MQDTDIKHRFPLDAQGLQSITSDGEAPSERFADIGQLYDFINKKLVQESIRSNTRSKFEAFMNGAKPFSDDALAKNLLGNVCNVNFNVGRDFLYLCMAPMVNIVFGSPKLYNVQFHNNTYTPTQLTNWGRVAAAYLDRLLRSKWRGFPINMLKTIEQRCQYGRGTAAFLHERSWQFTSLKDGALLAPKAGASTVDEWEGYDIVYDESPVNLYSYVQDEETAIKMGWNPKMVYLAIASAQAGVKENAWTLSERFQEFVRRQDFAWLNDTSSVRLHAVYSRGFDNKLWMYIVPYNPTAAPIGGEKSDYLFKREISASKISEILHPFLANMGDTVSYHSIRGEVFDAFPRLVAMNMLICDFYDKTRLNGCGIITAGSSGSNQMMPLFQGGGLIHKPAGMELKFETFPQLAQGPLQGLQFFRQFIGGQFVSTADQGAGGKGKDYQSAQAKSMDNKQASEADLIFINIFLNDLSWLGQCIWNRLTTIDFKKSDPGGELALEFLNDLKEAGIPEDVVKGRVDITSAGSANMASAALQQSTAGYLYTLMNNPGVNMDEVLQMLLTTTVGNPDTAAALYVKPEDRNLPTPDSNLAEMEDALMSMGKHVSVAAVNNHIVHMKQHLNDFMGNLKTLDASQQQGGPDQNALKESIQLLNLGIQHCKEHYSFAERDQHVKPVADNLIHQIASLENTAKQMEKSYQKMVQLSMQQQQAQQQAAADPTKQVELQIVNSKLEFEKEKQNTLRTQAQVDYARTQQEGEYKIKEINARIQAEQNKVHIGNLQTLPTAGTGGFPQ